MRLQMWVVQVKPPVEPIDVDMFAYDEYGKMRIDPLKRGSALPGELVEGIRVPQGVTWIFPKNREHSRKFAKHYRGVIIRLSVETEEKIRH